MARTATSARTRLPPGPPGPGLRQIAQASRDPMGFFGGATRRYGDPWTLRFGAEGRMVVTADPEKIKQVLTADPEVVDAGRANAIIEPLVGHNSVLLLDGAEHLARRRLLLPPFHGEQIQRYRDAIRELADAEIDSWPVGEPIVIRDRMQRLTLEVILRIVFGVRGEERAEHFREVTAGFVDRAANMAIFFPALRRRLGPLTPWAAFMQRRSALQELILEEIATRRREPDAADRGDVLSLLLAARDEDGRGLSDEEMRDELMTALIAGHETTATGLAWAVELLGRHPAVLERLRTELVSGDESYLDATITEVLRIRPPVFDAVRYTLAPYEIGGYELPRGIGISILTCILHMDPEIYPEPEGFRPERFLDARPGTYTWTPFGGGRRRCLGAALAKLEMNVMLRRLVERTDLEFERPDPEVIVLKAVTLIPKDGVTVRLTDRRPG